MNEMLTFLGNASAEKVNLYLVERSKYKDTGEISYDIFNPTITSAIGEEILESIKNQVNKLVSKSPAYIEYGILPHYEGNCIETIKVDDIPNLSTINSKILGRDFNAFDGEISYKFLGYIVRVHDNENVFYGFNKSTPAKLLNKGKFTFSLNGSRFNKLDSEIIMIETDIHAATLITNNGLSDARIHIFNKSKFESFFSFIEEYHRVIESNTVAIQNMEIFDNYAAFIDYCKSDMRMAKKFARIAQNGFLEWFDTDRINSIVESFGLEDCIDSNGKLKVMKKNMWTILRILEDDYLRSDSTDEKYESHSKVKK